MTLSGVFRGLSTPRARSFERALAQPGSAQARLRREIALQQAATPWGRRHGVRSASDFHRLPLCSWADFDGAIERGEVVCGRVVAHELTSGSGGPQKRVPLTRRALGCFSDAVLLQAHDVLRTVPVNGALWLAVTPRLGVAEGLADERDYLQGPLGRLLASRWIVPEGHDLPAGPSWQRAVARGLAARSDLAVVSVWSPSLWLGLLDRLQQEPELAPASVRSAARSGDWQRVWPQLQLLSCWDGAAAAPVADRVRQRMPGVWVQGKGLWATEGAVTIPWRESMVPLVQGVVIEVDVDGEVRPLDTLRAGQQGDLVISLPGGLPRYRLGDRVRVGPRCRATPTLELVGRSDDVVDLVGEKLSEQHVLSVLAKLGLAGRAVLTPAPSGDGYVLLCDVDVAAAALEEGLCRAHHYALARALGQLQPARVQVEPSWRLRVEQAWQQAGVRLGDAKPIVLWRHGSLVLR